MRSYPLQASPQDVRRFFPLAVRTSGRPAVVLAHAADPRQRLDRAATLLDEAWALAVSNEAPGAPIAHRRHGHSTGGEQ